MFGVECLVFWARKRGVASKEAGLCQFSSSVVIPTNGGRHMFNFCDDKCCTPDMGLGP